MGLFRWMFRLFEKVTGVFGWDQVWRRLFLLTLPVSLPAWLAVIACMSIVMFVVMIVDLWIEVITDLWRGSA